MPQKYKALRLLSAAFLTYLSFSSFAAHIPDGVKLDKKQVLNRGNSAEPASLDPSLATGKLESFIFNDLFEALIIYDDKGNLSPGVAERWETKDNQNYTFYLRKNAKWSDGTPVTAHDFVFGFQRSIDPQTGGEYANYFEQMNVKNSSLILTGKKSPSTLGVQALDDFTLKITLESPLSYVPSMLTHQVTLPLPKHVVQKYGDKWTRAENMVSNGAFKLKKWVVNERIEAVKNPHYWGAKDVVLEQVNFLPLSPGNPEMNRYLAGDLDMTYEMPSERFTELAKKYPSEIHASPMIASYYYLLNFKKPPLNDVRVRRALALSIDRDIIAKKVAGRGEQPLYTLMPPNIADMTPKNPDWAQETQAKRLQEAKRLLAEAGFGPDNPLRFSLLYNTSELHKKNALAIASMWQQSLGIKISLINKEWKTYLDDRREGNFEIARAGWYGDYNEPSTMLNLFFSTNPMNQGHYMSKRFDQLMLNSIKEVNTQKRADIYQQALDQLNEDMPFIPIYQYSSARMVKPYVGGYPNNPMDVIYSKNLYITAR